MRIWLSWLQEIFELSHDGTYTTAESITRYETGEFAVMNLAAAKYDPEKQINILAVGHNEKTQLYQIQLARDKSKKIFFMLWYLEFQGYFVGSVANGVINGAKNGMAFSKLIFDVTLLKSVQTDYRYPCQR